LTDDIVLPTASFYLSWIDYITDTTIIHKILKIRHALLRTTITLTVPAHRQFVEQG
jgi:hypothetical protein